MDLPRGVHEGLAPEEEQVTERELLKATVEKLSGLADETRAELQKLTAGLPGVAGPFEHLLTTTAERMDRLVVVARQKLDELDVEADCDALSRRARPPTLDR